MAFLYATLGIVWLILPSKKDIAIKVISSEIEKKKEEVTEKLKEKVKEELKEKIKIDIRKPIEQIKIDKPITSWVYYLKDIDLDVLIKTKTDMVIIDLAIDDKNITKEQVQKIKDSDKVVIAYLSLGEAENYREYWNDEWKTKKPTWLGNESSLWKGNFQVKELMSKEWTDISKSILRKTKDLGFDGILIGGLSGKTGQEDLYITRVSEFVKKDNDKFKVYVQDYFSKDLFDMIDGVLKQGLSYNLFGVQNKNVEKDIDVLKSFAMKNKTVLVIEFVTGTKWDIAKKRIDENNFLGVNGPLELNKVF
jgi:cysteinyl-tRNA synthetase